SSITFKFSGGDNHMTKKDTDDCDYEGREQFEVDVDRMVNEGLGGGQVTAQNGLIEETTTDTLNKVQSIIAEDQSCIDT
ncbi:MAG: hypothetical protein WD907_00715, partial [Bacilli bacterium]